MMEIVENEQSKIDFSEELDLVKPVVEALIFAAQSPINVQKLLDILGNVSRTVIREAISRLKKEYREKSKGIRLLEISGGYHFRTDPAYRSYVMKLTKAKPTKLSQSTLETLAIIAYKQPIIKAEVEDIRGVDSGYVIRALLEKKLIKILGKKNIVGKPLLYGTTREFLTIFSLNDLSSLPTLKDINELGESGLDENQLSLL